MTCVGGNALQVTRVTSLDYFLQVTRKITHYFINFHDNITCSNITQVTFFTHLFTDTSPVPMLREIGRKVETLTQI